MIIAHDLGTTGNKASLHDDSGRMLRSATISYGARFANGGVAEQNPNDWWNAIVQATRELMTASGIGVHEVAGIVISGQMMGAVLLDEHYEPVRPAIIWADTRSTAQTAQLEERIGTSRAYRVTGHRINPTYSIEKVMWVRDNEPQVFDRVRYVCAAKDFVVHRLTGRLATDRSDASAMNAYDQLGGTWSDDIIEAAGLSTTIFPEIVESTDIIGELTSDAAATTGLATGTRVVMGGGDGPIAAVGAGIVAPENGAYVCLGTSSWISFASPEPVYDSQLRTMTFNNVVPNSFVPTATMQAGGAAVEWINGVLSPSPDGATLRRLVADARTADAASDGLYFLPYLMGERSPHWNPDAAGAFIGLGRHHTHAHLARAVLEGVAFNLRTCLEAFRDAGAAIDGVDAIGGGASSDEWLQIMADVWGVPVRRRSVVEEANSLGAAVTGAVGLGLVDSFSAARELSEVTAEFTPDSGAHSDYVTRHATFTAGYNALESWNTRRHN